MPKRGLLLCFDVVSAKVIYPKYCKNSNETCTFCFQADWLVSAVIKFSAILLKYPTFEGVFSYANQQNKTSTKSNLPNIAVSALKL